MRNTVQNAAGGSDSDDNSGADALQSGESAARTAGNAIRNSQYNHKLKQFDKAEKLGRKSDDANVEALFKKELRDNPEANSNPISRWRQKRELKKRYMAAKSGGSTGASASSAAASTTSAAKSTEKAAKESESLVDRGIEFVKSHSKGILIVIVLAFLVVLIAGVFSSCTAMFTGSGNAVLGGS